MAPNVCLVFCLFSSLLSSTWVEGLQPQAKPRSRCPAGAYAYRDGLKWYCYEFFDEKLSFPDAEALCQDLGGHLASIRNEQEADFIGSYVTRGNERAEYVWIGLQREATANIVTGWRWMDGSWFMYTNWYDGEPNNYLQGNEYCAVVARRSGHKKWYDSNCYANFPFLCKWKPY